MKFNFVIIYLHATLVHKASSQWAPDPNYKAKKIERTNLHQIVDENHPEVQTFLHRMFNNSEYRNFYDKFKFTILSSLKQPSAKSLDDNDAKQINVYLEEFIKNFSKAMRICYFAQKIGTAESYEEAERLLLHNTTLGHPLRILSRTDINEQNEAFEELGKAFVNERFLNSQYASVLVSSIKLSFNAMSNKILDYLYNTLKKKDPNFRSHYRTTNQLIRTHMI